MGGSPSESLSAALAFAPYERRGPFATATHPVLHVGTFYYPVDHARLAPGNRLPVFVFACGTYQYSYEYAPTLHHIASFGVLVLGVQDERTKVMSAAVMLRAIQAVLTGASVPPPLAPAAQHVDASRLVVGGHSGGGPVALEAAAALIAANTPVRGFVAQHAAAIPAGNPQRLAPNRPTAQQLDALAQSGASMLSLCGVKDAIPYCSCDTALSEYFERFDGPKLLVKVLAAEHMAGTAGLRGDRLEGPYLLTYLLATFDADLAARDALLAGRGNEDILYYLLDRSAAPTIVTYGLEYQVVEASAAAALPTPNATAASLAGDGGGVATDAANATAVAAPPTAPTVAAPAAALATQPAARSAPALRSAWAPLLSLPSLAAAAAASWRHAMVHPAVAAALAAAPAHPLSAALSHHPPYHQLQWMTHHVFSQLPRIASNHFSHLDSPLLLPKRLALALAAGSAASPHLPLRAGHFLGARPAAPLLGLPQAPPLLPRAHSGRHWPLADAAARAFAGAAMGLERSSSRRAPAGRSHAWQVHGGRPPRGGAPLTPFFRR